MNMRSSAHRQENTKTTGHPTGTTMTALTCSVSLGKKRNQLKTSRPHRSVSRQTVDLSLSDRCILLRQQAVAEAQQGNYAGSIALFTQLIERNPDNAIDYNNRGLVYFQSGQYEEAIADYDKALELNPRLDSAYNNRANYHAAVGQLLEAILDYDAALDINPSNVRAWINQGITFRDLRMFERAIESFDLALSWGKLEGHIYAERGRTYHFSGDWNCAIADYHRALEALPQSTDFTSDPSVRLSLQVKGWLDELIAVCQG